MNDDDGIIRRILRTSVEDIIFIRVVRIFRMIEESVCNDCSSNYFLFKSVMKNSVVGVSGEASDRSISKSPLIKASVVGWQIVASVKLRSIWLWYQLCVIEASAEK